MIYLVEFANLSGATYVQEYSGRLLWDVVADAEADITRQPECRVAHIWPIDEAPRAALSAAGLFRAAQADQALF